MESERENLLERQREGIAIAKREGKYMRRKKKELDGFSEVYKEWKFGKITAVNAAKLLGINSGTFYKRTGGMDETDKGKEVQGYGNSQLHSG